MSSESASVAIEAMQLSKCYSLYEKPIDRLKQFFSSSFALLKSGASGDTLNVKKHFKEYWALGNITFSVFKGETVGIVGRNGAGKSTLLQILCKTLTPSSGQLAIHGRVAALLELGSGFNPEFTGRENIFLNCAVLGLTREQTENKFSSIVKFADIGNFIEQPVKTYSSGMMMRLAFAVIAHVDADILIIDEALAVGDAVFTQKCMRFLRRFMKTGTVLFVSHDSGSILSLCSRVIWLDKGDVKMIGPASEVVEAYTKFTLQEVYGEEVALEEITSGVSVARADANRQSTDSEVEEDLHVSFFTQIEVAEGWETGKARIDKVLLNHNQKTNSFVFKGGEKVTLSIFATILTGFESPIIGWFVRDRLGQSLFGEHTYTYLEEQISTQNNDCLKAEFDFTLPMLPNGDYSITVSIAEGDPNVNIQHHWLHDAVIVKVSSNKLRYGLMGIPFSRVTLRKEAS